MQNNLSSSRVEEIVVAGLAGMPLAGKRVLLIVPDATRSCPLGAVARLLHKHLRPTVAAMDMLIALGTHPPMNEAQIDALLDVPAGGRGRVFGDMKVFNHEWNNPESLAKIGSLSAGKIQEITGGLFAMDVDVRINRLIFDYDALVVVGPVFPHEVVGFSGGSKYFFPGISGPELLNFFHWLGAVITNPRIIGHKHTPVRRVLEQAAAMIPRETFAFCMVIGRDEGQRDEGVSPSCPAGILPSAGCEGDRSYPSDQVNEAHNAGGTPASLVPPLAGLFAGAVADAWSAAADLSDRLHIEYLDRPFASVLSQAPPMYDELWVGGKCMYKLEPVVADGGELIIYGPHIREISVSHGRLIEQIGYHTRDYFVTQWDRFKEFPWGVLAHSTHVRGIGTCEGGVEKPRIMVTLATGIDEATCRRVNLGYRDPASIDVRDWQNREDRLHVPKAGEMLYRLKNPPAWQRA
ncbi:MAG: lactate racemase domain-containing protein [Phycisphaerae bacterium]|nr:lactate racemase domain-containing protein [Phycisphaerae bacterium]